MQTLKFKTNIMCGGCIATVTPHLNSAESVEKWEVDTANPNKILSVHGENLSESEVIEKVRKAGYIIEKTEG